MGKAFVIIFHLLWLLCGYLKYTNGRIQALYSKNTEKYKMEKENKERKQTQYLFKCIWVTGARGEGESSKLSLI